jgi:hypothetical protein
MKVYTLDQVQDKLIGKIGTPDRDVFENELQAALQNIPPANWLQLAPLE